MKSSDIFVIIVLSIFLLIVIISLILHFRNKVINKLKYKQRQLLNNNELCFIYQDSYSDGYGSSKRYSRKSLDFILSKFRSYVNISEGVTIETLFNGIHYAVFDLDIQDKFDLFKKLYNPNSYVLFISSSDDDCDHYWGILDVPYKNFSQILYEPNWKICNDENYVKFCYERNSINIRGIFENKKRKPYLYEINGNLSENFKLFINKLTKYYDKEGFELSVLRYKDPELLIKYNRKRKLEEINAKSQI